MKKITFFLMTLFFTGMAYGQYQTVLLNYEKSSFGENEPLPAHKYFMLSGVVSQNIPMVEIKIYSSKGKEDRDPIFETEWKRDYANNSPGFNIPINYKLREGKAYDILVNFYREVTERELAKLQNDLFKSLDGYVDQSFTASKRKMKLVKNYRQVMNDLNSIVLDGMSLYKNRTQIRFVGFSDLVKFKLKNIQDTKLRKGKKLGLGTDSTSARLSYRDQLIQNLKDQMHHELQQYLNGEVYVLADDKFIDDYPTENLKDFVALNVGYGAALMNDDPDNFNYAAAPYLGISFPFGKEGISSKFWSRTSVSIGAMLQSTIEDTNGDEVTGPIFKVPVYAGLGYRVYRFIRLNAGVTFLEDPSTAGTISGLENRVEIKPFVGLSAEFNFWIELAK